MYPPAGMLVDGMIYFLGFWKLSLRNQPPMLTAEAVGLCSSIVSIAGGSVCVETSLITMPGRLGGAGSSCPGEPFTALLMRQLLSNPQVSRGALASIIVSENPAPSVT